MQKRFKGIVDWRWISYLVIVLYLDVRDQIIGICLLFFAFFSFCNDIHKYGSTRFESSIFQSNRFSRWRRVHERFHRTETKPSIIVITEGELAIHGIIRREYSSGHRFWNGFAMRKLRVRSFSYVVVVKRTTRQDALKHCAWDVAGLGAMSSWESSWKKFQTDKSNVQNKTALLCPCRATQSASEAPPAFPCLSHRVPYHLTETIAIDSIESYK